MDLHVFPIPLGHPSAPALSTCLMHPTWTETSCIKNQKVELYSITLLH